jgi:hypothetical protein
MYVKNERLTVPVVEIDKNGALIINASPQSSLNDFDFFVGKWKLQNKKLKTRLNNCAEWEEFESTQEMYKIINGLGNIDNFLANFNGQPFEGMSLRLFNPVSRLWSIYWADSNRGVLDPPVVGSFENGIGHFFARDVFENKNILVVFRWDARDTNNPIWSQAFSDNEGFDWEWNWFMYMSRIHAEK